MSASREAPMDAWIDYAKCSGLLDAEGVAPDSARAQTAWNAYTAAWNAATRAATSAHSAREAQESQPEPPLSVARIAHIGDSYPWEISLVWHVAVPDLKARGVVVDALLYVDPLAAKEQQ
jgi:hypothetical protein